MSDTDATGFAKFVPGFDFLQNLAKGAGASVPHMPNMGNWVAPTLNVEELDKRIEELKNVQFWLEQNSRALAATVQALEVQRMTLVTLKSMNFNLNDLAAAFQMKAEDSPAQAARQAQERAQKASKAAEEVASGARKTAEAEASGPAQRASAKAAEQPADAAQQAQAPAAAGAGLGDPLQLWGALTQQFQQIASQALQEVTAKAGIDLAKAANVVAASAKPAKGAASAAAKKAPAKKPVARKAAAKKTSQR